MASRIFERKTHSQDFRTGVDGNQRDPDDLWSGAVSEYEVVSDCARSGFKQAYIFV